MVGAMANSEVETRGLVPALADIDGREAGADGLACAGDWMAAGLGPEGVAAMGATTAADATGLTAAGSLPRAGETAGGLVFPGMPGIGPPVHIRVLAGPAGLLAPPPPEPAMAIGLPQAWQKLTGWTAPGLGAGIGAWQ
jgi:hypothetical protein